MSLSYRTRSAPGQTDILANRVETGPFALDHPGVNAYTGPAMETASPVNPAGAPAGRLSSLRWQVGLIAVMQGLLLTNEFAFAD